MAVTWFLSETVIFILAQVFSLSGSAGACVCKDNYVLWPENGECYKAFTPSPCRPEEFIIPKREEDRGGGGGREIRDGGSVVGACVRNPCPRAHLYFPDGSDGGKSIKCHKVGSRGPCPLGDLVVFEKYSGKSYRGECGCSPGYNQVLVYRTAYTLKGILYPLS